MSPSLTPRVPVSVCHSLYPSKSFRQFLFLSSYLSHSFLFPFFPLSLHSPIHPSVRPSVERHQLSSWKRKKLIIRLLCCAVSRYLPASTPVRLLPSPSASPLPSFPPSDAPQPTNPQHTNAAAPASAADYEAVRLAAKSSSCGDDTIEGCLFASSVANESQCVSAVGLLLCSAFSDPSQSAL